MENDMNNELPLRSIEAVDKVFILFVNSTSRMVDIIWIDYQGNPVPYMTLDPGGHSMLFTFKTHPWIFRDYHSGERMHVRNEEVYWPVPLTVRQPFRNKVLRKQIVIHFPMRSLKENSMWVIVKLLKNIEDIDSLEIPLILKLQLKNKFHSYFVHTEKLSNALKQT